MNSALTDDRPLTLAISYLSKRGYADMKDDRLTNFTLCHWREEFYAWSAPRPGVTPCVYRRVVAEELVSDVTHHLNEQLVISIGKQGRKSEEPLFVNSHVVTETIRMMRALCQVNVESMPAWIGDGRGRPNPQNVVAFQNGLLDVTRFIEDPKTVPIPPTPAWFSETVLPCDFDRTAKCPRWIKFLETALGGDDELVDLLQQWFGYCITNDTSHQKMLWLYGKSGAGKGTVARMLQAVVGPQNTAGFSLRDLTGQFTLSAFLGKSLAISGDAHLGRDTDSQRVIEQLKAITGEDTRMVDRKNRELLANVRLRVRFVILVNQFPSLPDKGDTLRRRLLLIPFNRPIGDAERDRNLGAKLESEVAGVTLWALGGLRSLYMNGGFATTHKGAELQDRLSKLWDQVWSFVSELCDLDPPPDERPEGFVARRITKEDLYKAYMKWSKIRRNGQAMHYDRFCEEILGLKEAHVESRRSGRTSSRRWVFEGISLNDDAVAELESDSEPSSNDFLEEIPWSTTTV